MDDLFFSLPIQAQIDTIRANILGKIYKIVQDNDWEVEMKRSIIVGYSNDDYEPNIVLSGFVITNGTLQPINNDGYYISNMGNIGIEVLAMALTDLDIKYN